MSNFIHHQVIEQLYLSLLKFGVRRWPHWSWGCAGQIWCRSVHPLWGIPCRYSGTPRNRQTFACLIVHNWATQCRVPTDLKLASWCAMKCHKRQSFFLAVRLRLSTVLSNSATIFTALHGMQTRSCDEISVCPSVCPSVKRVHCDKTEEKSVQIFYTVRKIIQSSFMRRRMVGGGDPFYLKFWVNRAALERNRRFWTNNRS